LPGKSGPDCLWPFTNSEKWGKWERGEDAGMESSPWLCRGFPQARSRY
jgi:hypothetical protein